LNLHWVSSAILVFLPERYLPVFLITQMIIDGPPTAGGPVGRCIYCGSTDADLREEHILPFGLGGNHFRLPKASCRACERITGTIEQQVLKGMLKPFRARAGFPSREGHPPEWPLGIINTRDEVDQVKVDIAQHPSSFILAIFPPPGIVLGQEPTNKFKILAPWIHAPHAADAKAHIAEHGGIGFIAGQFFPMRFGRMLAKIAHGVAVSTYGPNGFAQFLPDIILGKSDTVPHFVGTEFADPKTAKLDLRPVPDLLHQLNIAEYLVNDKDHLIIASIRLFAYLGAPTFSVVVGRPK
jgi:hypothetical protein